MKLADLLSMVKDHPWFDLATLGQLSGERRSSLTTQLHRWSRSGKILSLRRGMYALSAPYRRMALHPAALANELHSPSYLSIQWALSYHGIIPEGVPVYTSITTRIGRTFTNPVGEFHYTHIKLPAFFGYSAQRHDGMDVMVALPEKALLDHWYRSKGEWTRARVEQMRYQNTDLIERGRLDDFAQRFGSPRLLRAVAVFWEVVRDQEEGTMEI